MPRPLIGHGCDDFDNRTEMWGLHVGPSISILLQSYHSHQSPLMATVETLTTTVSTKGQIILPKAIRQRRNWAAGTRLVVEDTPDGVVLKAAPVFAPTRP